MSYEIKRCTQCLQAPWCKRRDPELDQCYYGHRVWKEENNDAE